MQLFTEVIWMNPVSSGEKEIKQGLGYKDSKGWIFNSDNARI